MAAANNSIPKRGGSLDELALALGETKFDGASSWHQSLGGLIFQGGTSGTIASDGTEVITFQMPYGKQVLGVFTQSISAVTGYQANAGTVSSVTTSGFSLGNDGDIVSPFYWFAIGV
jgi:hypothetical protein